MNNKQSTEETLYRQPAKCVSCVWGRWEASRQFCMRPFCCKQPVPAAFSSGEGVSATVEQQNNKQASMGRHAP